VQHIIQHVNADDNHCGTGTYISSGIAVAMTDFRERQEMVKDRQSADPS
jgi:hypothetical protein